MNLSSPDFNEIINLVERFYTPGIQSVEINRFYAEWSYCVASVIETISSNTSVIKPKNKDTISYILNEKTAILCLEFCQMLVEDIAGNHNMEAIQCIHVNDKLNENVNILNALLNHCFQTLYPISYSDVLLEHVFKTYGSWVVYFRRSKDIPDFLLSVTLFIFDYIKERKDESLFHIAINEVVEIIDRLPSFYSSDLRIHLTKTLVHLGEPLIKGIIHKNDQISKLNNYYIYNNDDDIEELESFASDYAKISIALCECEIGKPDRLNSDEISTLFEYMLIISGFPGIPYVDNKLAMYILEFWTNYIDSFIDTASSSDISETNPIIIKVVEIFWNKSAYPPENVKSSWNFEIREAFESFRKDFWELLDMAYPLIGSSLFLTFSNNIISNLSLNTPDWVKIEASLASISCLSDTIPLTNEFDVLSQLLSSSLISRLGQIEDKDIRITCVNFIGNYDTFFETDIGQPFLFPALDYLFKSLNVTILSNTASKSIQKLCSSSRSFLSNNLDAFFNTYINLKLYEHLDNISHQRIVLSISFVVQALKNFEMRATCTDKLLTPILGELEKEFQKYSGMLQKYSGMLQNSNESPYLQISFDRLVSLLRCIANVGKGLQEPDDFSDYFEGDLKNIAEFWDKDMWNIRSRIIGVIKVFAIDRLEFQESIPVIEACCDIFKSGFSERSPGPFVFSIDTVLDFISSKALCLNTLPLIINFSNCFVTSFSVGHSKIPSYYINSLIDMFSVHIEETLNSEPEAQNAYLKLLEKIICRYMDVFLSNKNVTTIMKFSVLRLASHERFVLGASAKFWCAFILSKSEKTAPFLLNIGPCLVDVLVDKISGDATRSELDLYIDVIKQLMLKKMMISKPWFENSLLIAPNSFVDKVNITQRRKIFQQLNSLRGNKNTNYVVKEYWLSARGITDYI
ncbi:uncharacterized protein SAPINGB_P006484 [Magnusiomyces paraingens]|uniref:Uncharacterized protein n=1 Tax=Magnusiomyces paraingens TaxID=2606893 RepID=A0A5E8C657_9ASCO|nr:uncharacterized protein SAPINGB_P006484 [Saprochaete ingens]VVT58987.1 unnamed protein product [Saprochaete ingens]